jgi:NAD(P)-dependent dehydrogenase (short-subunit alcohol dehydrogenase family)
MTTLVTGAAGGIGSAIYAALRENGSEVLGHDLPSAERTGLAFGGDLCDLAYLDRLAEEVTERGPLNAVVVAHGIEGAGLIDEVAPDATRRIMAINFESVIALWERLRPALESTGGVFVVIVSQAGLVAERGNGVYSASKAAVAGWLRAVEGPSVRIRLIHPGVIRTPLLRRVLEGTAMARGITFDELVDERFSGCPAGRVAEPAEIADAVVFAVEAEQPAFLEVAITGGEVLT